MTQEEINKTVEGKMGISAIIMVILFMIFYLSFVAYTLNENDKEYIQLESQLSTELKSQCKNIAKSQERSIAGGMTVHSSYWGDYKQCLTRSVIHKKQYGREDLLKS